MTKKQFRKLADKAGVMTGFKTYDACELVMVRGLTQAKAAAKANLAESVVSRALVRLRAAQEARP